MFSGLFRFLNKILFFGTLCAIQAALYFDVLSRPSFSWEHMFNVYVSGVVLW